MVDDVAPRILNRYNSWSRIDITVECFSAVCQLSGITPYFLHFVVGMGRKFSSKDEDFMSCYSTLSPHNDSPISSLSNEAEMGASWCKSSLLRYPFSCQYTDTLMYTGLCYNIRYFERHGRDLEDPWSCRQSALHHSFSPVSMKSNWVVIQAPKDFDANVRSEKHAMSLHFRYLSGALSNWRQYLDSFAQRFNTLVSRLRATKVRCYHR